MENIKKYVLDIEPAKNLLKKHKVHKENYEVELDGVKLSMKPDVFCPVYTKTSSFLASFIEVEEGDKVLDIFCGSGYQGISAAKKAKEIVFIDHSSLASECTQINVKLNGIEEKTRVYCGNLFEPIKSEKFDVIIANPPLLPINEVHNILETAIFDPNYKTFHDFMSKAKEHLSLKGRIYLIYTDVAQQLGNDSVEEICKKYNLNIEVLGTKPTSYEIYSVYKLYPNEGL